MSRYGRRNLPAAAWIPGDGSANNLPARMEYIQSDGAGKAPRTARWVFEDDEYQIIHAAFQLPEDFEDAKDVKFKFTWNCVDLTEVCYWTVCCSAISESDVQHIGTKDYGTTIAAMDTSDGTTLEHNIKEITLDVDNAKADDWFGICLERRGASQAAFDKVVGDVYFIGGVVTWEI